MAEQVELAPKPTREQWLQDRKGAIGASDVAAILGISPFSNAWEVWAEKTNRLTDWKGNNATRAGQAFERAILDEAERELGKLERDVRLVHPELPVASTLDARVEYGGNPVEAKTTGLTGRVYGDWGDALTDQVPDYSLVQVHTQLLVTGAELAYLFALIAGRGVVKYQIERSDAVCDKLATILTNWWDRHVVRDIEPAHKTPPALDVVKRFRKTPKKTVVFDMQAQGLVDQLLIFREKASAIKKQIEATEAQILLKLSDAEAAELPDGRLMTHYETSRKGYEVKPCTFRTITVKDTKGKK